MCVCVCVCVERESVVLKRLKIINHYCIETWILAGGQGHILNTVRGKKEVGLRRC
jgi:hypothetical protein